MADILYGIRTDDGKVVNIDEVSKGLDCNCICPQCKVKLIAKKGDKNIHHFAHYGEQNRECNIVKANESALHLMAKQIILEEKAIMMPALKIMKNQISLELPTEIINQLPDQYIYNESAIVTFDNVVLEKKYADFKPDIVGTKLQRELLIEIAVTHEVDEVKRKAVEKLGISMVEIDLSQFMDSPISKEKLKQSLLMSDNLKKWIYHRSYKDAITKAHDFYQNHEITIQYRNRKRMEEEEIRKKEEKKRRKEEETRKQLAEFERKYPNNEFKTILELWESRTKWMIAMNMLNYEIYEFYYDPNLDNRNGRGVWGRKCIEKEIQDGKTKHVFDKKRIPVKYWNKRVWVIVHSTTKPSSVEKLRDEILKLPEEKQEIYIKENLSKLINKEKSLDEILKQSRGKASILVKNNSSGDICGLILERNIYSCRITHVYLYKEVDGKLVDVPIIDKEAIFSSLKSTDEVWKIYNHN